MDNFENENKLLAGLRALGIKTAGFHLDRYWGLDVADKRETNIGHHPWWSCDKVFTADGGHQEEFRSRGVNHFWLPPGIAKRNCIKGKYRKELASDVGFVGAIGYHPEWPWREEMIEILKAVYGERFRIYQGFRGEPLADVYASCKVVVGDCCFAGEPKYWSDRLPESCGRGAFLLHPQIQGMCIPTATYTPKDSIDLLAKIDYYLEHDAERRAIAFAARRHVREHDTYHERMRAMLREMGI